MGKMNKFQDDRFPNGSLLSSPFQTGKELNKLNILTTKDLVQMTDNFSKKNFIGKFQFGRLYRGFFKQQHLTIKIWDPPHFEIHELANHELRLMDELILLRHQRLAHPLIVSLYGYCRDKEHVAVVYNLKSMDSLHNLFLKEDFTWVQRIKVAFSIACFLKFVQDRLGDLDPFLIRNLSAAHVILDEEYNPKLVDFSMITGGIFPNKQVYYKQPAYGCSPYREPYLIRPPHQFVRWTKESDIFSFGVMLISLLSKRFMMEIWLRDDLHVSDWALQECEKRKSLVHESLQSDLDFYNVDGHKLSMMCVHCTSSDCEARPDNMKVVQSFLNLCVFKDHKELLGVDKMFYVNKNLYPSVSRPLHGIIEARDTQIDSFDFINKDIHTFSFCNLKWYTNNFSQENYIGRFKFGKLFRGFFHTHNGGLYIIVKIWDKNYSLDENLLKLGDEMVLFHHEKYTCHPGMVRMFGYCTEDENVAIVFFCKPIDSIHNLLPRDDFKWLNRIKAACGVASLLKFLHDAPHGMDPFIIGNLDATHILLDEKYNPKLVDFGLISGGIFPNRPVDDINGTLTKENDVYCFGFLLMCLITKRCIEEPIRLFSETPENSLVHPSLREDPIIFYPDDENEITRLVVECMQTNPACRPTMSQVVEALYKLKLVESDPEVMGVEKIFREKCRIHFDNPYKNMPKRHYIVWPDC